MKLYIISTLFLLAFLAGCTGENELADLPTGILQKKAQVVLTLSVPAASLPTATRAADVIDDKEIKSITLWAFDHQNNFLYQIDEHTTENGKSKITIKNNKVYVLLPESSTNVQLSLITNTATLIAPAEGTSKAAALQSIPTYTRNGLTAIPMYGESKPFVVKEGATPGTIKLTRAMAQLEVDATNAWPLFELHSAEVINVNSKGTVVANSSSISNLGTKESLFKQLNSTPDINNNKFEVYIPEASGVNSDDHRIRSFVLLYGKNKSGEFRYYRLDFIKRTKVSGEEVQYTPIETFERNHRYTFHIEHIVPTAGSLTREEAINKELADNGILGASVEVKIIDENIMDITTDNQYYLGVTSSQLEATLNVDGLYYIANMNVVANYEGGWEIDDLPSGVEVSVQRINQPTYDNGGDIIPTSVWIYIEKNAAEKDSDRKFIIYVYSRNIRKTITITLS